MIRALALALIALPAVAQDFPPPAPQQPPERCDARAKIVYRLANQFDEFAVRQALMVKDGVTVLIEWFEDANDGSMTIVVTTPDMRSCMLMEGEYSSASMPVAPGEPS